MTEFLMATHNRLGQKYAIKKMKFLSNVKKFKL